MLIFHIYLKSGFQFYDTVVISCEVNSDNIED